MNTSRFLPIINLVGCLALTGVIVAQWIKERGLDSQINHLTEQLTEARGQFDAEHKRTTALEHDITQLKEAIEATAKSSQEAEEQTAEAIAERDAHIAKQTEAAQQQVQVWQKAIAERDEKIRSLNANLIAARSSLEQAIAKLKSAGAQ